MRTLLVTTALLAAITGVAHPQISPAALPSPRVPPPKAHRVRPLVAIVAENGGAETADFTIPYAVLPAQIDPKDEALTSWIRRQASGGAVIVSAPETRSKHGLRILTGARPRPGAPVVVVTKPGQASLEEAFAEIGRRYGAGSVKVAKTSMEYDEPRPADPLAAAAQGR